MKRVERDAHSDSFLRLQDDFWSPEQLAKQLRVSVRTLLRWHAMREGPPRVTQGRLILYRIAAVQAWLASREK